MSPEEAEIARTTRRELNKRPIDADMIDVQVRAGRVVLGGRVAHRGDQPGVNLRAEIDIVTKHLMGDRLIRQVIDQLHYKVPEEKEDTEHSSRGRMRH